jgi:hypothetical protein
MIHCAWSAWWLDPCSPGTGHLYKYLQLQQKMNRLLMQKQIGCSCKSNSAGFSWQCWSSLVSEEGYEHKDPALGVLEWYDRDDTGDDEDSGWTQKVVLGMLHSLHLNRFNWDQRKTTKQLTLILHVQNQKVLVMYRVVRQCHHCCSKWVTCDQLSAATRNWAILGIGEAIQQHNIHYTQGVWRFRWDCFIHIFERGDVVSQQAQAWKSKQLGM